MLELGLKARTAPVHQEGLRGARAARLEMGTKGSAAVTSKGGGQRPGRRASQWGPEGKAEGIVPAQLLPLQIPLPSLPNLDTSPREEVPK